MSLLPPLPPTFEAALRDVDADGPEFRLAAAHRLGDPADEAEARRAAEALRRACLDALAPVREAALVSVGQLARAELLPAAEAGLADPHPAVRRAAAVALGQIGGPRALALLGDAARSPDPTLRADVALAATCLGGPTVAALLAPMLQDADARVRAGAAEALGELGVADHLPALCSLLDDPEPVVVRGAARALARLGDARSVPALRRMLDDPETRFEAVELLGTLDASAAREDLARIAARPLGSLLMRAAAGGALARLGDPRGEAALRSVLRALRNDGRGLAVELVGELRLRALRPELERLRRRPRGADPAAVARALAALAEEAPDGGRVSAEGPRAGLLAISGPRNETP